MALVGRLEADFSSFVSACAKAEVSLRGLDTGAGRVSTSLSKMVDSFSGRKLISEATLSAEAVERIGGTTKLTAAELQRLGAQATEAAAKLKALGMDVPPGIQKIADAAKAAGANTSQMATQAEKPLSLLKTTLGQIGVAFAAAFSVRAIAGAVTSFTRLSGSLTDLSAKTGISTTELQKLKYAAELSGGSLESVTSAIAKMARSLVEGDKGAVEATKRLGLNLLDLRQMQPGEAFNEISEAIAKVPSKMEQITLGTQLMGKGFADVLPMITGGMTEAFEAAERLGIVMDEQTVAAGDRLGDTFTTLSAVGQGVIGKVLKPMVPAIQYVADAMTGLADVVEWLQGVFTTFVTRIIKSLKSFLDATIAVSEFAGSLPLLGRAMSDVDKAAIASGKAWSVWLDDMAKGMNVTIPTTTKTTHTLKTAVGLLTDEQKKGVKATDDYAKALDRSAVAGVKAFREWQAAMEKLDFSMGLLVRGRLNDIGEAAKKQLGAATDATVRWIQVFASGLPVVKGLGDALKDIGEKVPISITPLVSKFTDLRDTADAFAGALGHLGRVVGGVFGSILQGASGTLTSFADLADATDTYRTALANAKQAGESTFKLTAQYAIQAAASVVGYVQTAIGIIEALYDDLSGKELTAALNARGGRNEFVTQLKLAGVGFKGFSDDASTFRSDLVRFDAAIAASTDRMERYGLTWLDLRDDLRQVQIDHFTRTLITDFRALERQIGSTQGTLKAMGPALSNYVQQAIAAGTKIPVAMKPILEQLIRMGGLTDAAARAMLGLEADTMPALADIKEAAERYGLTLDQLGPKVQQLRITETAAQIVKDFDLLILAGADVGVVMLAMKDQVQALVTNALKLGLSLPESMRPLLQSMIAAGLLTDQFGVKLTDVGQLTFAETLSAKIDQLIVKLGELIDHMSEVGTAAEREFGRARGAAEALGRAIPRGSVPTSAEPETSGTATPRPGSAAALAEDAAASATTLAPSVLANEIARGRVLQFPPPALPPLAPSLASEPRTADGAAAATTTIILELDSRQVAEAVVPQIPGVVQRYGLA